MKGSLSKSYNRSLIIDAQHIAHLSEVIEEDFGDVSYVIKTSDGARYELGKVDDVLSYNNPDPRKIVVFTVSGYKESGSHRIDPDISISLFDMSQYDGSCILSLNNMDEQEITYYTQRIDEFVKTAQTSYWWIHKPVVYWIIGTLLFIVFYLGFYTKLGKDRLLGNNHTLFLLETSLVCYFFSMFVVKRFVEYLFPQGGFAIGEQVKYFNKKEKTRNLVLMTIIGSLIIGIIAGVITHFIVG